MNEQPPCRCLLAENLPDLAQTVAEYVASLPENTRTSEETYQERLDICLSCESLLDGTCTRCGCYVEARAAKAVQCCPDVPPRWLPVPEGESE